MATETTNGVARVWIPIMAALVASVIAGMAGIIVGKGNGDLDLKYLGLGEHKQFVATVTAADIVREKEIAAVQAHLATLEAKISVAAENEAKISVLAAKVATLEGRLDTALQSKRAAK